MGREQAVHIAADEVGLEVDGIAAFEHAQRGVL
jgi:hypothetical protein